MWANTSGLFRVRIFIWFQRDSLAGFADYSLHSLNMYRHYLSYKAYPQQNRHKNEVNTMDKIMVFGKAKRQIYFW